MLPSEKFAIVATIDPDAYTAGAQTSDWVNVENWQELMAVVMAGTLGSSATLDFKLQQATDASGTSAKNITSASITQLTQAGTDSDKQAVINLNPEKLDVANGFTFVAMVMTVATATSDCGAIMFGSQPTYGPASDNDLASVDEIVTV